MLKLLVKVHSSLHNDLEHAFALMEILPLVECSNKKLQKLYLVPGFEKSKTGRELHTDVLFKIIELCISAGYDEYAFPYVDQIYETCVKPFQYIEIIPRIDDLQSKLYHRIATADRNFSSYFKCTFIGQFDRFFKGRSFVYRRDPSQNTNSFINEMKSRFPAATVQSEEPDKETIEKGTPIIQVTNVLPSNEEEMKDPYYCQDYKKPKYQYDFNEHDKCRIFKMEIPKVDEEKLKNGDTLSISYDVSFIRINQTFPFLSRRIEIVETTPVKSLSPLEATLISTIKKNNQINLEKFWICERNSQGKALDPNAVKRLFTTVSSTIQINTTGTTNQQCRKFLSDEYVNENPDDSKFVPKFKEEIKTQVKLIEESVAFLRQIETDASKPDNISFETNIKNMKESLNQILGE